MNPGAYIAYSFDPLWTPSPSDLATTRVASLHKYESSVSMYKLSVPNIAVIHEQKITASFRSCALIFSFTQHSSGTFWSFKMFNAPSAVVSSLWQSLISTQPFHISSKSLLTHLWWSAKIFWVFASSVAESSEDYSSSSYNSCNGAGDLWSKALIIISNTYHLWRCRSILHSTESPPTVPESSLLFLVFCSFTDCIQADIEGCPLALSFSWRPFHHLSVYTEFSVFCWGHFFWPHFNFSAAVAISWPVWSTSEKVSSDASFLIPASYSSSSYQSPASKSKSDSSSDRSPSTKQIGHGFLQHQLLSPLVAVIRLILQVCAHYYSYEVVIWGLFLRILRHANCTLDFWPMLDVGCIYAPCKVNPNIFQFYFDFMDIFHHPSMHPLFCNIYEFYLIFYYFISSFIIYNNYLYLRQYFPLWFCLTPDLLILSHVSCPELKSRPCMRS